MYRDPVCGMIVDPATAIATREHAGQTFYFRSQQCVDTYDDPHRYGHQESEVQDDEHRHHSGYHH